MDALRIVVRCALGVVVVCWIGDIAEAANPREGCSQFSKECWRGPVGNLEKCIESNERNHLVVGWSQKRLHAATVDALQGKYKLHESCIRLLLPAVNCVKDVR